MGTIWIREFTGGLDTRKLPETSQGGTLVRAVDGHINRGGEFEQRAAFVPVYTLPKGTVGLAFTKAGPVVFGSIPDPGMPNGVAYQRLQHPDGATDLIAVRSFDLFAGKIFAAGEFADGKLYQFYDGKRVTHYGSNSAIVPGAPVRTFGRKLYYVTGPNLIYSNLADPTNFDPDSGTTRASGTGATGASTSTGVGAGFNDLSEEDYGSEDLVAIGRYQNYLAIFSDRTVQIRYVDPDPALSKQIQALHNTGTISPRSVTEFGDTDLFYLDASGLRSLKARDASNAAVSTDIGSAIDVLLTDFVAGSSPADVRNAIGVIEPRDGRFWLAISDTIFVFSYFPAAKVSAWTIYKPGFKVEDMIVLNRRVYLRSGNQIYVYGGLGAELQYDATEAVAWLPYLDGDRPTETKTLQGVDAAVRGSWRIEIGMDPANLAASDKIGEITETTFMANRIPGSAQATHFSLRFRSHGRYAATKPAVLGSAAITYLAESDKARA
ncbi:hypothetical protein [Methylobacterium brachiatum]|uniref:hypothetical protein n=1 Tax=Methylobacterium brachiatum TaxID=269660 RepID=UPI0008EF8A7B|nr:hypothetical protein [Methylobacterium brachiatum]SFI05751.1 hypothetical protein SAMN02799642_00575 [Methylobacterium brachiatum]